jgi:hypothetical protein
VIGSEGLAQRARVEIFNGVIRKVCQALVAEIVVCAGCIKPLIDFVRVSINCDLHFIDDRAKVGMEPSMENFAKMLQGKTFFMRC